MSTEERKKKKIFVCSVIKMNFPLHNISNCATITSFHYRILNTKLLHILRKMRFIAVHKNFFFVLFIKQNGKSSGMRLMWFTSRCVSFVWRKEEAEKKEKKIRNSFFAFLYLYLFIYPFHTRIFFFLKSSFFISFIKLYVYVHNHVDMIMSE